MIYLAGAIIFIVVAFSSAVGVAFGVVNGIPQHFMNVGKWPLSCFFDLNLTSANQEF